MDAPALQERFEFASALIEEAGALALGYFHRLDTLEIKRKGIQDVASEADVATELLIRDRLRQRFPEDGFLGEETGRGEVEAADAIWVVDPIDGTQPFVSGMSSWCISIALVVDHQLELGLVTSPARGELFAGRRGERATLNGRPISVSGATPGARSRRHAMAIVAAAPATSRCQFARSTLSTPSVSQTAS